MNIFQKIWISVVQVLGKIHWKSKNNITEEEQNKIRELLTNHYYIILTRKNNHLSTYMIALADFFLTKKLGHWSHALMNLEDTVETDDDFLLIEAVGLGVTTSHFRDVFECNSVALLKPKNMSVEYWTVVLDKARTELGKPYDNLFDLKNDQALSCVELVRTALQAEPNYEENFAEFEQMIQQRKNLTPAMFYECSDFETIYEVRRQ